MGQVRLREVPGNGNNLLKYEGGDAREGTGDQW